MVRIIVSRLIAISVIAIVIGTLINADIRHRYAMPMQQYLDHSRALYQHWHQHPEIHSLFSIIIFVIITIIITCFYELLAYGIRRLITPRTPDSSVQTVTPI